MGQLSSALPDYDKPPVTEVVFGVQFKKLETLKTPHIGFLWERFGRKKYPECQEMPPLNHILETQERSAPQSPTIETFTKPPLPRIFFVNATKNHLIQVQQDRFHQNWRKLKSDDTYPRYASLYPKFTKSWGAFAGFIRELNLGDLELDQYELTYVNHIPRGEGWSNLSDIENVFPEFQCKTNGRFLPEPENVFWRKIYLLPNDKGRLYVSLRLAVSHELKERIMILDLTARGFYAEEMDAWFEIAHEWIVRGFTDLTSGNIQKSLWKRKQ